MSSRSRWAFVVGVEALLIVLLLPFGLVFTGTPALHQFQLVTLGAGGAIGWIAILWRPTAIPLPLLLAPFPMLAALVVAAIVSAYPSLSWPAAWLTAAYTGIFWLLVIQARSPAGRRNLVAVIGIVVALAIASFLVSVVIEWRDWLGLGFPLMSLPLRPSVGGGLALLPTWLADVVAVGTPVVVTALWARGARIPASVLAGAALVTIVLSGTRSVLLIVAAVSIVALLVVVRARLTRRSATLAVAAILTTGVVVVAAVFGVSRSFDEGRSSAYASAFARITESPVIGSGPGTFGVERMHDAVDALGHLAFPDAHNIVLNTLAESGLVGLAGLLVTVSLFALASRRAWVEALSPDRLVIGGALFGLAVFAAHGMVDVVFGLVGIVIVVLAVAALASTKTLERAAEPVAGPRPAVLRAGIGAALLVVVIVSGAVLRTEGIRDAVAAADTALPDAPADAFAMATRATGDASDLVPGWWVRMVAADATGDPAEAIAAAREVIDREGFGQQWISLAVLAAGQGDRTTEQDAIAHATAGPPVDPVVELNVIALLDAAGDKAGAEAAARRLLSVQQDIEGILRTGPPAVAASVASVRADAAEAARGGSDPDGALLIALSGEDRALAQRLVGELAGGNEADRARAQSILDAWFGDETARAAIEASALHDPTLRAAMWAWRLAARACDEPAATRWDRALDILSGSRPTTPTALHVATTDAIPAFPALYPTFVWKLDRPQHPYVGGMLTFTEGRPACVTPDG